MDREKLYGILLQYRESSDTHDKRLTLLLERQITLARMFTELLSRLPNVPGEYRNEVAIFYLRCGNLAIEIGETLQLMADDTEILANFFKEGLREIDKEEGNNGTP